MNICVLTRFYPPINTEGIPRTRQLYARELVRRGHEVHVVTGGSEGYVFDDQGVWVHEIAAEQPASDERFMRLNALPPAMRKALGYSFLAYRKVQALHARFHFDLVDSPLWDLEGYLTKLLLPDLPVVIGLETTSRQMRAINGGTAGPLTTADLLERQFMRLADGLIFDSWSILQEIAHHYELSFSQTPYAMIHFGLALPPPPPEPAAPPTDGKLQVLIVSRLEKRKGTDLLVREILPAVLRETDDIVFHLVGRDCAAFDGFQEEHGVGYHDYCRRHLAPWIDRQLFLHGFLTDEELQACARRCEVALCLSRYESFGLLYLEALAQGHVVFALNAGAAPEVFHGCEGAFLFAPQESAAIVRRLRELAADHPRTRRLGRTCRRHAEAHFTAAAMAAQFERFYQSVVHTPPPGRIIQIMDCLQEGDGVSKIALDYHRLLTAAGYPAVLTGRHVPAAWAAEHTPLEELRIGPRDLVLCQYWNYNDRIERLRAAPAKKALIFQNITPPHFFRPDQPEHPATSAGYAQLARLDFFDLYTAPSEYSLQTLRMALGRDLPTRRLLPVHEAEDLRHAPCDTALEQRLRARGEFNLLFVGRVVESKCQADLVELVAQLRPLWPRPLRLHLVGELTPGYAQAVRARIAAHRLDAQVTLVGKVTAAELQAYYRTADLFVSASEHEGFGLPVVEAMLYEVPVLAYRAGAVAETLGASPGLLPHKDFAQWARLAQRVGEDAAFRADLLRRQREQCQAYRRDHILAVFQEIFRTLAYG